MKLDVFLSLIATQALLTSNQSCNAIELNTLARISPVEEALVEPTDSMAQTELIPEAVVEIWNKCLAHFFPIPKKRYRYNAPKCNLIDANKSISASGKQVANMQ